MKRNVFMLIVTLCVLLFVACGDSSSEGGGGGGDLSDVFTTDGTLMFKLLNNDTWAVSGIAETVNVADLREIDIPAEIDGKLVTEIGKEAFGEDKGFSNIETLNISKNIKSIDPTAITGMYQLKTITAVDNPIYAVANNCLVKGGTYLVRATSGFTAISSSIKTIGEYSFSNTNYTATSLIIPATVTKIESFAFTGWTSLKTITIPASVTSIGEGIFSIAKLDTINVSGSHYKVENGYLFGPREDGKIVVIAATKTCTQIPSAANIKILGSHLFARSTVLGHIDIPLGVEEISDYAFFGSDFTGVTISNTVTKIGNRAFFQNELTSVFIPSSVTHMGADIFSKDSIISNLIEIKCGAASAGANWDANWNRQYDDFFEVTWGADRP